MRRFFNVLYDIALSIGLALFLPKVLWQKKWGVLRQRLQFAPPDLSDLQRRPVIWMHAVSVGEVKSAKELLKKIKAQYPEAFIFVTTATATGQEEAKRSLAEADAFRFMPIDFSWLVRKWVSVLKPHLLLFIESDCWFQLLQAVKESGGKTALVSGKLSERSASRFAKVSFFAKKLFSLFDLLLVQNVEYLHRFKPFVNDQKKLFIGGNLKLDALPVPIDRERLEPIFRDISLKISLVSTHAPEESELLDALEPFDAVIFLAPRHPERFQEIADLLTTKNISYCLWSQIEKRRGKERVFLIDSMGQLPIFFSFCDLAIVAGSFSSQIGGHNVLEPCLYGTPVFFGPVMHQQKEFAAIVLKAGAGRQVDLSNLAAEVRAYIQDPAAMKQAARALFETSHNILESSWEKIRILLD